MCEFGCEFGDCCVRGVRKRFVWLEWIAEKHVVGSVKVGKSDGVCSAHFSKESYKFNSIRLKDTAVPSISPE